MQRNKHSNPTAKKVVGYIRISAPSKHGEGVSLSSQKDKIEQWASLNNAEILHIFEDAGISGTKGNRPGVTEAIELACKNKAIFIVYSLSRFSRSTSDTLKFTSILEKAGSEFVSISENIDTLSASGKMIFRVLAVLNQFEAEIGGERTKTALQYRKSRGLKNGGKYSPYGYTVDADNKLIKDPTEQATIKLIQKLHKEGAGYNKIAKILNTQGISAKKQGNIWYAETVKKVVNSTFEKSKL